MPYQDLREFLSILKGAGQLHSISSEVNWDLEIGAIMRKVFDTQGLAVLFEKVKGSRFRMLSGILGTYGRYAMSIGSEPSLDAIIKKMALAAENPLAPIMVRTGSCQDHIERGDEIDLFKFPTPRWHRLDGGRYIGTLGLVICKDPQTGIRNTGIYREQILDKRNIGILATQQVGLCLARYRSLGKPMPVATAIGVDPALLAASCLRLAYGQDELAVAGAIRGKAVELVKCQSLDLEVPAHAEIILEGEIPVDEKEWKEEGPFGEFTGYYGGIRMKRPVIQLKAVTYRDDPILQGTLEGAPPCESTVLRTIGYSAGVLNKVSRLGFPGLKKLWMTEMGCASFVVIASLERQYTASDVRQLIHGLWAASGAKWAIVVNDDIDIFDRGQVEWALATRVQPHRDIIITSDKEYAVDLDPSLEPERRPYPLTQGSRIGIDATINFKGYDFPPLARPDLEEMETVEARWKEYGF